MVDLGMLAIVIAVVVIAGAAVSIVVDVWRARREEADRQAQADRHVSDRRVPRYGSAAHEASQAKENSALDDVAGAG